MRFRQLIAGLGTQRTVVLSTHLVEDVAAVCTQVVVLWQGRVPGSAPCRSCASWPTARSGTPGGRPRAFASWRTESGAYRVLGPRPSAAAERISPTVEDGYLLVCTARQDTGRMSGIVRIEARTWPARRCCGCPSRWRWRS